MKRINVTDLAHNLLTHYINENSIVVDATCGNGNDTLFLAKNVKYVHAFDIQQQAITNTKTLTSNFSNISFYHQSFETITSTISNYDGVIFNLGYLPGSDKLIKTNYEVTIKTLSLLHERKTGFILVVVYPGHVEGFLESVAIQSWLDKNRIIYRVIKLPIDTKNEPPFIFFWNYKD